MLSGAPLHTEREYNSRSSTPANSRQSHSVVQGHHEWVIEDFLKREEGTGVSLSTRFTVPAPVPDGKYGPGQWNAAKHETVWRLKAYPKGCDAEHKDFLSLFINQVSGPAVWVKYSLGLLAINAYDQKPYVHNPRKGSVQFLADRRNSSRGWKRFLNLDSISSPGSFLLQEGSLVVRCSIEIEAREEPPSPQPPISFNEPSRDFLDGMKYCDLTLVVDNHSRDEEEFPKKDAAATLMARARPLPEFRCHKFMLAKKSDVFDAMFSHDFVETRESKVTITDLEPDAVLEMLRWIYTCRVQNLAKVHKALLAAADKYNIGELKDTCERSLCDNMTVDNVCALCLFAYARHSENLKSKTIAFIQRNIQAVTHSAGWHELAREPEIMTEIVRAMGPRV